MNNQEKSNAFNFVIDELLTLTTAAGMTVSAVAAAIHYDRTHLYNIISGRKAPSIECLNAWAHIFGRSVYVILRSDISIAGLIDEDCNCAKRFANEAATHH